MPLKPSKYRSTLALTIADPATARAFEDMARKIEQLARDANGLGGGDTFPSGACVFWLGAVADIPAGWSIATELEGRFPRGMASGGTPGATGGAATHTHTGDTSNSGAHTHSIGVSGKYGAGALFASDASGTGSGGGHTHTLNVTAASSLPPYVDGIWIRKD